MKDLQQLQNLYESIKQTNQIMFVRFGGVSPHSYHKKDFGDNSFHAPPVKYGLYAFIYPYIEPFLAAWKYKNNLPKAKFFKHHGLIWTHMIDAAKKLNVDLQMKDSWVLIHTKDLPKVLTKQKNEDAVALKNELKKMKTPINDIYRMKDPYKRGQGGMIAMDHLEVFIPEKIKETKPKHEYI